MTKLQRTRAIGAERERHPRPAGRHNNPVPVSTRSQHSQPLPGPAWRFHLDPRLLPSEVASDHPGASASMTQSAPDDTLGARLLDGSVRQGSRGCDP